MSLPKSFKLLTPYERANIYGCLEISAASLRSGIKDQNLAVINGALDEIQKRVKTLERAGVAQAVFDRIPKDFTAALKRKKSYKFGITFCPAVPHKGVKEDGRLFLLANGVKCAINFEDIDIVW